MKTNISYIRGLPKSVDTASSDYASSVNFEGVENVTNPKAHSSQYSIPRIDAGGNIIKWVAIVAAVYFILK